MLLHAQHKKHLTKTSFISAIHYVVYRILNNIFSSKNVKLKKPKQVKTEKVALKKAVQEICLILV